MLDNKRMIVYFSIVRVKDDKKHKAICDAAIGLITANGFSDTSMSKIAKAANVSPATIYVYFENKEDLLNKVYMYVKREMSLELLKGVSPGLTIEEIFKIIWHNFYRYATSNQVKFAFTEQFANSPKVDRISKEESMSYYRPLFELFERGKKEGVFKNLSPELFTAFAFGPLLGLIKQCFSGNVVLDKKTLALAYELSWESVSK